MKRGRKIIKYLLFIFLLGLIFLPHYYLPLLQDKGQILQAETLQGAFEKTHRPNFWPRKWMNGDYQKAYEAYVRDRNIITPFAVRLNTQLDYSLYNTIAHHNILLGKNREFYTKTDCESYVGIDYKGEEWIEEIIQKLKHITTHYEQYDIPFLILLPSGKPGLLPEYLPDFYQQYPIESTNRMTFKAVLEKENIDYLDFDFLKKMKTQTSEALLGEASLHWSRLAYISTADSLRAYIARSYSIPIPKIVAADTAAQVTAFSTTDKELVNGANFLKEPRLKPLPYQDISFELDSTLSKQRILSIGDSYYLSFYKGGIHDGLFDPKSKFLYYNHEVYPQYGQTSYAHDLDILSEIERSKLVIITVYETNLKRFGFNFIEKVYDLLIEQK